MSRPPPPHLSEVAWQSRVVDLARTMHWHVHHVRDSRTAIDRGFPDLVLVKHRVIFAELKTATGRLGPGQADWLEALTVAGATAVVWRPADWTDITRILCERTLTPHAR